MPYRLTHNQRHRRKLVLLLSVSLFMGGCKTVYYGEHPLVDEILTVHPSKPGKLVNVTYAPNANGDSEEHIQEYDLADANLRDTLNKFNFVCSIGGRRFKICEDKPGFCRISYSDGCWLFCPKEKHEEYLPVSNSTFMLQANVKCVNKNEYPLPGINSP